MPAFASEEHKQLAVLKQSMKRLYESDETLMTLNLSHTQLTENAATQLGLSLRNSSKLAKLRLVGCGLSPAGVHEIRCAN